MPNSPRWSLLFRFLDYKNFCIYAVLHKASILTTFSAAQIVTPFGSPPVLTSIPTILFTITPKLSSKRLNTAKAPETSTVRCGQSFRKRNRMRDVCRISGRFCYTVSNLGHWLLTALFALFAKFCGFGIWIMSKLKDHIHTHTHTSHFLVLWHCYFPSKDLRKFNSTSLLNRPSQTIQRELKVSILLDYRFIIGYFAYRTDIYGYLCLF